jgi:hypothetical protein
VQPRDKIGIVGRTGSGKSSLIVALFRMVEPFKGEITLDGANLLSLGLEDVRGRIAAIPQVWLVFVVVYCWWWRLSLLTLLLLLALLLLVLLLLELLYLLSNSMRDR